MPAIITIAGCRANVPETSSLASTTGIISGELGYPSDWVPPMLVCAKNVRTDEVFFARTGSSPSIHMYGLEVSAPGKYIVYAWTVAGHTTDDSVGSYYLGGDARSDESPDDLSMKEVKVEPDQIVEGIDIFFFGDLPRRVPEPPYYYEN